MSATITHGETLIQPVAVSGYEAEREPGNILHPIIGSEDVDVTFRPARRRSGTLTLVFADAVDAAEAVEEHATSGVFSFTHPSWPLLDMLYVVTPDGQIGHRLAASGEWVVTVPFQEVPVW